MAAMGSAQTTVAGSAMYRVTVRKHWTAAAFSIRLPSGAHLTGIAGAVHGAGVDFWALGTLSSTGIKDMAERGTNGQPSKRQGVNGSGEFGEA